MDFVNETDGEVGVDGEILNLDMVFPIPLTPEILEKNDITLLEVGDDGASTPPKYRNRYEKWLVHTQWRDTYLWFDRRKNEYHFHNMNGAMFTCVHQLQHALRLCGIDKEITL